MKIKSIELLYGEKTWVQVTFDNGVIWVPSFNELGKVINLIGKCEDEKYPSGKGKDMVIEFLQEVIYYDTTYEEFCPKWNMITNKREEKTRKLI